jgi:hypothetical protein
MCNEGGMYIDHVEYIDGMGESGLAKLNSKWYELDADPETRLTASFRIFRVPLAAHEEEHRSLVEKLFSPVSWDEIRKKHGIGRYEIVLIGPPPRPEAKGMARKIARVLAYAVFPWLDASKSLVPLGRASAAMFGTIRFEDMRPPMPRPIATDNQPSLFNPEDVAIPKYVAGSDTSFMAAENIAPLVSRLQNMVLDVILNKGTSGATCDEVEVELDMPHQTASARINELKEDDLETGRPQMLFDIGVRRRTRHGQFAIVWVHRTVLHG